MNCKKFPEACTWEVMDEKKSPDKNIGKGLTEAHYSVGVGRHGRLIGL